MALDPVTGIANVVDDVLKSVLPDPAAKAAAQAQVMQLISQGKLAQLQAQTGIISAEASSANKLASSWRPMLMYIFMAIIANNYILAPYLQAIFHTGLQLQIPPDMWELLKIGVGGYIVGRSVEKATVAYSNGRVAPASSPPTAPSNIFSGS